MDGGPDGREEAASIPVPEDGATDGGLSLSQVMSPNSTQAAATAASPAAPVFTGVSAASPAAPVFAGETADETLDRLLREHAAARAVAATAGAAVAPQAQLQQQQLTYASAPARVEVTAGTVPAAVVSGQFLDLGLLDAPPVNPFAMGAGRVGRELLGDAPPPPVGSFLPQILEPQRVTVPSPFAWQQPLEQPVAQPRAPPLQSSACMTPPLIPGAPSQTWLAQHGFAREAEELRALRDRVAQLEPATGPVARMPSPFFTPAPTPISRLPLPQQVPPTPSLAAFTPQQAPLTPTFVPPAVAAPPPASQPAVSPPEATPAYGPGPGSDPVYDLGATASAQAAATASAQAAATASAQAAENRQLRSEMAALLDMMRKVAPVAPPSAAVLRTPDPTTMLGGKDADRVVIPVLPPEGGYETWRFQTVAAVQAASAKPYLIGPWIAQVRDTSVSFQQLGMADPVLGPMESKLFMALLVALGSKGATATEHEIALKARTSCQLGCGRQLLRLVDAEYGRDVAGKRQKAMRLLLSMRQCGNKDNIESTLLQMETLMAELRGTDTDLSPDFLASIIRHVFGGVNSLSSVFAVADMHGLLKSGTAQPLLVLTAIRKTVLDARDEAMVKREFKPATEAAAKAAAAAAKAASAAAAAAAAGTAKGDGRGGGGGKGKGKKGDGKGDGKGDVKGARRERKPRVPSEPGATPCPVCQKPGHTKEACWFNPESPNYKGPRAESASAEAGHPTAASSTSRPTGAAAPATPEGVAASFFATLAKQLDGKALPAALPAAAGDEILLDSGASYHLIPKGRQESTAPLQEAVHLHTVQGEEVVTEQATMAAGSLGPVRGLLMPEESPSALALGRLVREEGADFVWLADDPENPRLTDRFGRDVPLQVRHDVPSLRLDAPRVDDFLEAFVARTMGAPGVEGSAQEAVAPDQPEEVAHEAEAHEVDLRGEHVENSVPEEAVESLPVCGHNWFTHRPADPTNCYVCRDAKMKQTAARRVEEPERADRFGLRVHADTIGPLKAARDGSRFILVAHDENSIWCIVVPTLTKRSAVMARAFARFFGFKNATIIRADPGLEFTGAFSRAAEADGVQIETGIPRRPQTHSRSERFHQEVEGTIRAFLLQSGLPHDFWADAARVAAEHLNRTSDLRKSPHEMRFGRESDMKLIPFGAGLRYLLETPTKGTKLMPRTKPGVFIGYYTARGIRVLDLALYVQGTIHVAITRDYRLCPGDCGGYTFPYAQLQKKNDPTELWHFEQPAVAYADGERGPAPLCPCCGRPRADEVDLANRCEACKHEGKRRPGKSSDKHKLDVTCDLARCMCREAVEALVPEVDDDEAMQLFGPSDDSSIPDGFMDYGDLDGAPSALVVKAHSVGSKLVRESAAAQDAISGAVQNLFDRKVIDPYDKAVEWRSAAEQDPGSRVVRAHIIVGMKHSELGGVETWKARVVGGGNNVRDTMGRKVVDVMETSAPASLVNVRLTIIVGHCEPDGHVTAVDITSAYLHAKLKGEKHYLELPKAAWPDEWHRKGFQRPVLALYNAIPGLQQSGCLWHEQAVETLLKNGWEKMPDVEDMYTKSVTDSTGRPRILILVLYVDDALVAGARLLVDREIDQLSKETAEDPDTAFEIGTRDDLERFLGTKYEVVSRAPNGYTVIAVSQVAYATKVVERYMEVSGKRQLRKTSTPASKETPPLLDFDAPGAMAEEAPAFLGELQWLCRCSRPDIAQATGALARHASSWSLVADRCLEKIMCYLNSTLNYGLVWWLRVGDMLTPVGYFDADHGSCIQTARSTSGSCVFAVGRLGSVALTAWASKAQTCAAASTGEAETVAANETCRKHLLPVSDVLGQLGHDGDSSHLLGDSSAALQAIDKGISPNMRYLRKNQRISIACLHDYAEQAGVKFKKEDTSRNVADMFTKPLDVDTFSRLRHSLGVVDLACVPSEPPVPFWDHLN